MEKYSEIVETISQHHPLNKKEITTDFLSGIIKPFKATLITSIIIAIFLTLLRVVVSSSYIKELLEADYIGVFWITLTIACLLNFVLLGIAVVDKEEIKPAQEISLHENIFYTVMLIPLPILWEWWGFLIAGLLVPSIIAFLGISLVLFFQKETT